MRGGSSGSAKLLDWDSGSGAGSGSIGRFGGSEGFARVLSTLGKGEPSGGFKEVLGSGSRTLD